MKLSRTVQVLSNVIILTGDQDSMFADNMDRNKAHSTEVRTCRLCVKSSTRWPCFCQMHNSDWITNILPARRQYPYRLSSGRSSSLSCNTQ